MSWVTCPGRFADGLLAGGQHHTRIIHAFPPSNKMYVFDLVLLRYLSIVCALCVPAHRLSRPDSSIYVEAKIRAAGAVGMQTVLVDAPTEGVSAKDLEEMVSLSLRSNAEPPQLNVVVCRNVFVLPSSPRRRCFV